ncbi:MAG: PEP-CTERM sorting domain-containing protein [Crocosphaera sp.]|nr:PEP-CTERM sorting domain-containing protein [Crocosphaera sp.]
MFGLKPAAVVGTAIVSSVVCFIPQQAQALTLTGKAEIGGAVVFNTDEAAPATDTIDFVDGTVLSDSTGSFFERYLGFSDDPELFAISDIALELVSSSVLFGSTFSTYEADATNPLVTFSDGLEFSADNPFTVLRTYNGTQVSEMTIESFTGTFTDGTGTVLGQGIFSAQIFQNQEDGSYSMSLEAVPEPLTILGAGAAVAFGGAFKRKLGKKNKKESTKA